MKAVDMSVVLLHPVLSEMTSLPSIDLITQGMLYMPSVFIPLLSFTGRRELEIFCEGRPTDLMFCMISILLMGLEVILTGWNSY
jgi:hypothetical protein